MGIKYWGLVGLLLLCAGCAPQAHDALQEPQSPNLRVAFTTTPSMPLSLDPTSFTARIADSAGKPVSGAKVKISLAMPSMDMGENNVPVHENADGAYTGTGRFTMEGAWRVTVAATQGKERTEQIFLVQVK